MNTYILLYIHTHTAVSFFVCLLMFTHVYRERERERERERDIYIYIRHSTGLYPTCSGEGPEDGRPVGHLRTDEEFSESAMGLKGFGLLFLSYRV